MLLNNYRSPIRQYLIILPPDENSQYKISDIKYEFADKIESEHAKHSKGHVSAINIYFPKEKENQLFDFLKLFCFRQNNFNVNLHNFGGFPHHTIYIDVLPNKSIVNLQASLYIGLITKVGTSSKYTKIINKPHLTIARNLTPEQYNLAIKKYEKRSFEGSFSVKGLGVLFREVPLNDPRSYMWNGFVYIPFGSSI